MAHHRLAPQAVGALVERGDAMHLEDHAQLQVVLQVAADAGQLVHQRHAADSAAALGGTDAGTLQDGRRADGAGREQGLDARRERGRRLVAEAELDAARLAALHGQRVDQRAGHHLQVAAGAIPGAAWPSSRIPAHALLLVHLEMADAEVVAAVVVAA
jgi:hypothetical protein